MYVCIYILIKGTITVANPAAADANVNSTYNKVILKNCPPFTNCISSINNTQVNDAHDIDVVMSMYNLIDYNVIDLTTSGSLWQYYRNDIKMIFLRIITIAFPSNLKKKKKGT